MAARPDALDGRPFLSDENVVGVCLHGNKLTKDACTVFFFFDKVVVEGRVRRRAARGVSARCQSRDRVSRRKTSKRKGKIG